MPVAVLRAVFPAWAARHVEAPAPIPARLTARLEALVDATPDADLEGFLRDFRRIGEEFRFYPAHPFGRAMSRGFMPELTPGRTLEGRDRLEAFLAGGPRRRLVICNHLSYTDTQITDSVLAEQGFAAVADRLVAVAGPKVYTDAWRRLAAISLNTRKTAQSSLVATEQGSLSPRELAKVALDTVADCARLMDEGWIILLYPEGTRARNGVLQPFLRAVSRYTSMPDTRILVMAQTGTERIYPIDEGRMHPAAVRIAFAEAFDAADFPGKTGALGEAHALLAALLLPGYRPDPEAPALA